MIDRKGSSDSDIGYGETPEPRCRARRADDRRVAERDLRVESSQTVLEFQHFSGKLCFLMYLRTMSTQISFWGVALAGLAGVAGTFGTVSSALAHGEVFIGRRASGQLTLDLTEFPLPFHLEPSFIPGFPGFAAADVGVVAAVEDHPVEDFFMLSEQSNIELVIASTTPGIIFFNGLTPLSPGEAFPCGAPIFHLHPIINVPAGDVGQHYFIDVYARDVNNIHAPSATVRLEFETVPTPGVLGVAAVGLVVCARRRRG